MNSPFNQGEREMLSFEALERFVGGRVLRVKFARHYPGVEPRHSNDRIVEEHQLMSISRGGDGSFLLELDGHASVRISQPRSWRVVAYFNDGRGVILRDPLHEYVEFNPDLILLTPR